MRHESMGLHEGKIMKHFEKHKIGIYYFDIDKEVSAWAYMETMLILAVASCSSYSYVLTYS